MKLQVAVVVTWSLFALQPLAGADPADDAGTVVGDYVTYLEAAKADIASATNKASACKDAVAAARKAGATTLENGNFNKIGGKPSAHDNTSYVVSIDRAEAVCDEYALYEQVAPHAGEFSDALSKISLLTPEMSPGPDFVKAAFAEATACTKTVEQLLAAKVPPTFALQLGGTAYTLGEIKVKVCVAETEAAARYSKEAAAAQRRAEARYAKLGITGDKMHLMMEYEGSLFLPGGASSSDLRKYAAASVMFVWTTSDPDGEDMVTHTVRRYQFTGNKLVKTTSQEYRRPKGAKLGDVFH